MAGEQTSGRPERPSERRGAPRTAVVWDALRSVLAAEASGDTGPDGPDGLDVLDIGGGTGGFAVRVAADGHRVVVVDPSPDALAALGRRGRELGVDVVGKQGDLGDLGSLVEAGSADVVLCHGVFEVVDRPDQALAAIRRVLRPGGTLSVLVAQRHAGVIGRALAGHFNDALALLGADPRAQQTHQGRAFHRYTAEEMRELLLGAGFETVESQGVRVFADLVPGALLEQEPGAVTALVELERAVAHRPEYLPLATQLHLLAR